MLYTRPAVCIAITNNAHGRPCALIIDRYTHGRPSDDDCEADPDYDDDDDV